MTVEINANNTECASIIFNWLNTNNFPCSCIGQVIFFLFNDSWCAQAFKCNASFSSIVFLILLLDFKSIIYLGEYLGFVSTKYDDSPKFCSDRITVDANLESEFSLSIIPASFESVCVHF